MACPELLQTSRRQAVMKLIISLLGSPVVHADADNDDVVMDETPAPTQPEHSASGSVHVDGNAKQFREARQAGNVTLLLFYQYVEPSWSAAEHDAALTFTADAGKRCEDLCFAGTATCYCQSAITRQADFAVCSQ